MLLRLLLIASAGAMGAICRYGLSEATQRIMGAGFPWGTLVVNIGGSFSFGMVWSLSEHRNWMSEDVRLIVLVGFMGAFTTFSSFAFDTHRLAMQHSMSAALFNVLLQNALGWGAIVAGIYLGR